MKSMNNARPLANEECSVLAYNNGWQRFDHAHMVYHEGGGYDWVNLDTNEVIENVKEWEYN